MKLIKSFNYVLVSVKGKLTIMQVEINAKISGVLYGGKHGH